MTASVKQLMELRGLASARRAQTSAHSSPHRNQRAASGASRLPRRTVPNCYRKTSLPIWPPKKSLCLSAQRTWAQIKWRCSLTGLGAGLVSSISRISWLFGSRSRP